MASVRLIWVVRVKGRPCWPIRQDDGDADVSCTPHKGYSRWMVTLQFIELVFHKPARQHFIFHNHISPSISQAFHLFFNYLLQPLMTSLVAWTHKSIKPHRCVKDDKVAGGISEKFRKLLTSANSISCWIFAKKHGNHRVERWLKPNYHRQTVRIRDAHSNAHVAYTHREPKLPKWHNLNGNKFTSVCGQKCKLHKCCREDGNGGRRLK